MLYKTQNEIIDRPSKLQSRHLTADWHAGSVGCVSKFYFLRADARVVTLGVFLPDVRITQSAVFFVLKSFKSILFNLFKHIPLIFIIQTIRRWNQRIKNVFIKI
jgi:hypothetical protein